MSEPDPRQSLQFTDPPALRDATMLMALSGWMDGGDVSTGTVERLIEQLEARPFARIDPEGYYIYNFPGSMELVSLFRPPIRVEQGRLESIEMPGNRFYCDEQRGLVLFVGREPNLYWRSFGDCIFELTRTVGVKRILFVGSYAGSVPHTREPRLYATVTDPQIGRQLGEYGVRPTNYEGPGSFTTYLMTRTGEQGMEMINLVAEIPAYIQGRNPLSIEAVTRRLGKILDVPVDVEALRTTSNEWEEDVTEAVEKDEELAEKIRELEKDYDDDLVTETAEDEWPVD